jgi:hypothetical protein
MPRVTHANSLFVSTFLSMYLAFSHCPSLFHFRSLSLSLSRMLPASLSLSQSVYLSFTLILSPPFPPSRFFPFSLAPSLSLMRLFLYFFLSLYLAFSRCLSPSLSLSLSLSLALSFTLSLTARRGAAGDAAGDADELALSPTLPL